MAYILNIHTSTETAVVNLTYGENVIGSLTHAETKQHAAFLHLAIVKILKDEAVNVNQLSAVGVTNGPGSYTGIRIGLASAQGLCYALKIPLISYSSLHAMALSSAMKMKDQKALYRPLIDARRMEVYTALFNYEMEVLEFPSAIILNKNSFEDALNFNHIYFSGSGNNKFKLLINNTNATFINEDISPESMAKISSQKFEKKEFENVPYAQPLYIKEFHTI